MQFVLCFNLMLYLFVSFIAPYLIVIDSQSHNNQLNGIKGHNIGLLVSN